MVDLKGDFSNKVLETLEEWNQLPQHTSLAKTDGEYTVFVRAGRSGIEP
jgi:hypothetical protein